MSMKARVQQGHRVEVSDPQLRVGDEVDVTIVPTRLTPRPAKNGRSLRAFFSSLPPSNKTLEQWDEFEREFQQGRKAWDR
jgi:hypothetical protein